MLLRKKSVQSYYFFYKHARGYVKKMKKNCNLFEIICIYAFFVVPLHAIFVYCTQMCAFMYASMRQKQK